MVIEIPKEQEDFLIRQVEQGYYFSIDEAVRAAICEIEWRQKLEGYSLEELRRFVAVGMELERIYGAKPLEPDEIRREGMKIIEERRRLRNA